MYCNPCYEHILGVFFEPNCFEANDFNEEIWAVVTLVTLWQIVPFGKTPNLWKCYQIWCINLMWPYRNWVRSMCGATLVCGKHIRQGFSVWAVFRLQRVCQCSSLHQMRTAHGDDRSFFRQRCEHPCNSSIKSMFLSLGCLLKTLTWQIKSPPCLKVVLPHCYSNHLNLASRRPTVLSASSSLLVL